MRDLGTWGEAQVAEYLRKRQYRLLEHRFRCRYGEIDLIAEKDGVLCCVEVKLRSRTDFGLPREAVGQGKQQRLRTTAAWYLSQHEIDQPVRFDVAEVYYDESGAPPRIVYLADAFA